MGGALIGSAVGAVSQIGSNRANRKFQEKMYGIQRGHALEDRDYANAYNTPLAQRKRMEEAGLNPSLMYGSSPQNASTDTRGASVAQGQNKPILSPLEIASLEKLGAETEAVKIENKYKKDLYFTDRYAFFEDEDGKVIRSTGNKAQRDAFEQLRKGVQDQLKQYHTKEQIDAIKQKQDQVEQQIQELLRLNANGYVRGINWNQEVQAIFRQNKEKLIKLGKQGAAKIGINWK